MSSAGGAGALGVPGVLVAVRSIGAVATTTTTGSRLKYPRLAVVVATGFYGAPRLVAIGSRGRDGAPYVNRAGHRSHHLIIAKRPRRDDLYTGAN